MNYQDLHSVDWSALVTASGTAVSVPHALLGLLSDDPVQRRASYASLDNEIVLQSDLYESAYYVIPFLLNAIAAKAPYGRDLIYDLLYEIANGHAPSSVTCKTFDGNIMPVKDACIILVQNGLSSFIRDKLDIDPIISRKAKDMLDLLEELQK